jgi:type I restriction enzyme R subunit
VYSIQSNGVINLFEGQREFSLFDEGFLAELKNMKEKNLAVLLLERLVKERIQKFERTNVVQSQKFSELLNMALSNYLKGMLTNEEVIEELLKMAAEIKKTEEEGNDLGLNTEEKALEVVMAQCNKWADDDENLRPIVVNVTIEKHYHGNVDKVINIEQLKE